MVSKIATRSGTPWNRLLPVLLWVVLTVASCAPADPEIIAIEYLRATRTAKSDAAIGYLDIDTIVDRVQREVVLINADGDPDAFLRDSVETILWGLFQETPREDELAYDATPAEVNGDKAIVSVTMRGPDGSSRKRTVHLRQTRAGWQVSGATVDDLVSYVIQRLEERY